MHSDSPTQKQTNTIDESNEKDFTELNQAISKVIENQLDDPQDHELNLNQEQEQEEQSSAKYINHFLREKQQYEKQQMYYSPDMRKYDNSRVMLSPPVHYSKFGTPNINQPRSLWQGNALNVNMGINNNICFSPIQSYQYAPMYGNFSSFFNNPNAFTGNNYPMNLNHQPNQHQQMNKQILNKQKKKNKNKNKNVNEKTYISQSPNLKSLFANGKNGQCIKFIPNYVSNPLKGIEEQNQISLDAIIIAQDKRTTLMIKNIPNKYTIATFLEEINVDFKNKYDIFYLPIDYSNKCNLGFAFINFVDSMHIIDFYDTYRGKKWKRFNSEKICDLVYAKIQGKKELIAHFEKGKVLLFDSEDKRPLILDTPSPLPPLTIPSRLVPTFMMAYPFALYHAISNEKVIIDSFSSF